MQLAPVLLWTVDGPLLDQAGMFKKLACLARCGSILLPTEELPKFSDR